MGLKKQLGMGVATAALGLALVGGGTYAAFNDTATINNHFAAGTLDLQVGQVSSDPINFDLSNMKPGDNVQRIFKLNNAGTLAIKQVLLNVTSNNFQDGAMSDSETDFLSQFHIDFMQLDTESNQWEPRGKITKTGETLTLADLVNNTYANKIKSEYLSSDDRINLAPLTVAAGSKDRRGIPVNPDDSDAVFIQITFHNDTTRVGGPGTYTDYVQNKYMDDSINFSFNLEATQWDGVSVDTPDGNGKINNGVQGSSDGPGTPDPKTTGSGTINNPLND